MAQDKKKRNRNKNKGAAKPQEQEQQQQQAPPKAAAPEEPKAAKEPKKAAPKVNGTASSPPVDKRTPEERQAELFSNLALDVPPYLSNFVELRAAEARYHSAVRGSSSTTNMTNGTSTKASSGSPPKSSLAAEIAKARQHIKNSLDCVDNLGAMAGSTELSKKITKLEKENKDLKKVCDDLKKLVLSLEGRVNSLEKGGGSSAPAVAAKDDDDDEDVDLFGSDSDEEEEDAEKVRIREERLKAYHEKKAKKPALIAKTSVLLDVKPWDDETDMDAMLKACKTITKEGLVWGAHKLVPVGYGINKLQVMCVVEDEKVSIDELCEQISEFEDFVQSVDIAAMSKI